MVFKEAETLLEQFLDIEASAMQIQRICGYYGKAIDPLIKANCEAVIPRIKLTKKEESTYVMLDGSMLYTREDGWREMKLGRIFSSNQVIDIQRGRREIVKSIYVSHLGSVNEFLPKIERFLTGYKKKIFLADGAPWIWKWIEDNYPGAVQILDFYHAKEKLVIFAHHQFLNQPERDEWLEDQKCKLLNNQVEQVIATLSACRTRNKEAKEAKLKAIAYYTEHEDRMQYKSYLDKGLLIGSGPIEAAHRSVIQQRMKLSGQKWSVCGANAIANLRCYRKSDAWDSVLKIISAAA